MLRIIRLPFLIPVRLYQYYFGWKNTSKEYLNKGRLEDVIALITHLGMGENTSKYESTLQKELFGPPHSAGSYDKWVVVARRHPEFFRVYPGTGERSDPSISLIARHLAGRQQGLEPLFIAALIETATRLHQGQIQRRTLVRAAVGFSGLIGVVAPLISWALKIVAAYFKLPQP